jgi:hypothetical protein
MRLQHTRTKPEFQKRAKECLPPPTLWAGLFLEYGYEPPATVENTSEGAQLLLHPKREVLRFRCRVDKETGQPYWDEGRWI